MGMAPHTRKTYAAGDEPMTNPDLSTEALMERRALAEKATPGPWMPGTALDTGTVRQGDGYILVDCRLTTSDGIANAAHIAANSPDVAIATIDELLRLREENERMQSMIAALARKVANLTREWAKAGNVDNSAEYWVSWARHDAKAARRAVEQNYADQLAPEG